jgi:hypothetical protein
LHREAASATQARQFFPMIPICYRAIPEPSYPVCARLSVKLNLIATHAEEITMSVITIGKRFVPTAHVAFVELFDPSANPEFKPEKDFKGRVVLLNREIVLTEQTPQEFATEHDLHLFTEDSVAVNRTIQFKIEIFEPTESFTPKKPYQTRLKWNDLAGEEQSKLLLTAPETVIAEILKAKTETPAPPKRPARRLPRGRKGSRRMEAYSN